MKTNAQKLASAFDMEIVKQKLTSLEQKVDRFEPLAERMIAAADRMAGRVETLETEAKIGARVAERHTRQITALAEYVAITLPD